MQADANERATGELYRLLDRLAEVIEEETAALRSRDADALFAAVDDKRRVLRELSQEWPNPAPADLADRLRKIRTLNETAGGAIAALLHNTREALGLLGMPVETSTYESTGQSTTGATRRALAVG